MRTSSTSRVRSTIGFIISKYRRNIYLIYQPLGRMDGRRDETLFQRLAEISASVYGHLSKNKKRYVLNGIYRPPKCSSGRGHLTKDHSKQREFVLLLLQSKF